MISTKTTEKPMGEHAEKMVGPGAWPETDESVFTDRATQLGEKLSALTGALEGWGSHQASIFNGIHVWSGSGANAAGTRVEANAQAMRDHEQQLRDAIGWCNEAAGHIGTAKQLINDNVKAGIGEINQTLDAASESDQDPTAAIDAIVQRKYGENVATLGNTAKMLGFKGEVPAAPPHKPDTPDPNQHGEGEPSAQNPMFAFGRDDAARGSGIQPAPVRPPVATPPADPAAAADGAPALKPQPAPVQPPAAALPADPAAAADGGPALGIQPAPAPVVPAAPPATPGIPRVPSGGTPAPSPGGASGLPGIGGSGGGPSGGGTPSPLGSTSSPSVSPAAFDPTQAAAAAGPQTGAVPPQTPAQAFGQGLADAAANGSPPVQAASAPPVSPTAPPVSAPITDQAAPVPPPSALPGGPGGPARGPPAPAAPGGGGPMMGGPVVPPMPLGPPAAPPPAAPMPSVSTAGLGTPIAPPVAPTAGGIAGAPVPVSVARAERDAIARATRRSGGNDPAQMARRVAAALNAEPSVDFGFYWMTGLAADGSIVVANSYGIGYIPEGVNLPEQVKVASADESISAAERG
ncbi:MAG: hypothetical protein QOG25_818, partial [Acetobacteraceae bacterium]|nr:hypothetical protein [Acetobacteraceae bacterium]